MRRTTSGVVLRIAGFALAAILLASGGLLIWGSTYLHNTVQGQLAAQQITFPAKGSSALASPQIGPYLNQYAGQKLLTGQQAEAYADHFIAVHVAESTGGKTYSQVSSEAQANPNDTKLAGLVNTVFRGESLRGMLLNAYGWWKVSQIMYIASITAFAVGGLTLAGMVAGVFIGRRPEPATVIPHTGQAPAKAA